MIDWLIFHPALEKLFKLSGYFMHLSILMWTNVLTENSSFVSKNLWMYV